MKKIACIILCLALIPFFSNIAAAEDTAGSIARAEILIEAGTGQVLYSSNPDAKLPMASITKIMGLIIWGEMLEAGTLALDDKIKATSYASAAEGSVIWLNAGEEMTAAELLEAVIISSANDACIALAEHAAGSEAQFVKLMNSRARALGMKNTRFTNCVGYDEDGHYSTARDIATATAKLMKMDVYRGWMLTWMDYLRGGETQLVNTNKLVRYYDGILGGKTGTTDNAGCCLAACAERNGMRLITVVLGCKKDEDRFDEAERLLDHGFASFEKFTPETDYSRLLPIKVTRGAADKVDPIIARNGGECVIRKGGSNSVSYEYTFVEELEAPVEKGQFVGEYLVLVDGVEVFRSDIVAAADVPRMNFWRCLWLVLGEMVRM